MPVELSISPGSPLPIYRQIIDQVRYAIATGKAEPRDPLPSVRALAEQLLINPNTVAKAYAELVRDGLCEAQVGKAVVIAPRQHIFRKGECIRRLDHALAPLVHEALSLGLTPEDIRIVLEKRLAAIAPPIKGAAS